MTRSDVLAMAKALDTFGYNGKDAPEWTLEEVQALVTALNLEGWYLTRDQKDVAATLADYDYETEGLGGT